MQVVKECSDDVKEFNTLAKELEFSMNMQIRLKGDETDVPIYMTQASNNVPNEVETFMSNTRINTDNTIVKLSRHDVGTRCGSSQGMLKKQSTVLLGR